MVHFRDLKGQRRLSWLGIKSLKHKSASTFYTLGCEDS